MEKSKTDHVLISVLTAVCMAGTAFVSLFIRNPYIKEALSYSAQGWGQDIFDMVIVAPLLIIAAILMRKGSRFWENLWAGAMIYILYSYMIYGFAVHFNYLFLAYCSILGLSFFGLVFYYYGLDKSAIKPPVKFSGGIIAAMIFLSFVAFMFAVLWLSDVIPALINRTVPKAVAENNFFTSPVHVMDLSFALPACVLTVVLLARKKASGMILAPAMLSLAAFMMTALGAMILGMRKVGIVHDVSQAFVFVGIGIIAAIILAFFSRE